MKALFFLKKPIKGITMTVFVAILVLTPLVVSISPNQKGIPVPKLEQQQASALLNVGLLENRNLNASYDSNTKILTLKITGSIPVGLGALNSQYFVYKLPDELKPILSNSLFKNNASIDYRIGLLANGTIPGSLLTPDPDSGTVTGIRDSVLNISLLTSVTATLTINLGQLGMIKLPPSPDGVLEFNGIMAREALIDLNLFGTEGASDTISTDFLPLPPTINPVHDTDTAVTGSGEAGATIHIITPSDSYNGPVNADNTYSISIPEQAAGTEIKATQTSAAGIESHEASTIVIGVILVFADVPNDLPFQTTTLGLNKVTVHRAVSDWKITVRDTRGQGSRWKITARAERPMATSDGLHTLDPDALIYVKDNIDYSLIGEVLIFDGTTGPVQNTTIQWGEDEGVLMKMTPMNLETGVDYATTIDWALADAP